MKYKEIANNKEINAYLQKGNANLGQLGFTDHSKAHCVQVAHQAGKILKRLEYYFEIFLERMMLCRKAAEILGTTFKLTVNGRKVL